ncbi:MAG: GNAT family N-acetyltransferase [Cognatishimia sp.]|uniref:GNAT family N-acetyltransferase n=1 Tax=Cognatishimia sp. TaxID=2211648 RepID=UPI003B8B77FC
MTPEVFADIHASAFRESRPWSASEFKALLASRFSFWVGDSQGFALGRVIAGESELLTIAVSPISQRKGKGRALLQQYHLAARNLGAQVLFLEVAKDNIGAIALYESEGYSLTSVRKGYYKRDDSSHVDALNFRRSINLQD